MQRYARAWFLLAVLAFTAGAAGADAPPVRPLSLQAPGRPTLRLPQPRLSPARLPADSEPREFPSVLRDPQLPLEPDGLLWRRLREEHPQIRPLDLLRNPLGPTDPLLPRQEPIVFRILALRFDFLADTPGSQSTTVGGGFDLRHPDSARVAIDPPPHDYDYFAAHLEAVTRYYRKQSGGMLELEWELYPQEPDSAYHLSDTAEYGPWLMSSTDAEILDLAEKLVRDAFAVVDSSDAPPDFRAYDGFIMFHAGADLQGDVNRDSPYDIPSFNIQLAEPVAVQDSTFLIDLIMVMPEYVSQDGYLGALNGVMTHEFAHQLGFFDLYNVFNFFPQVGIFSLMDSGDNLYGSVWDPYREIETFVRGAIPASIDPWHKLTHPFFRDGLDAVFVDEEMEVALEAVQTGGELAVVPIGGERVFDGAGNEYLEFSEYFILENRPFDLNGDGTVYLQADSTSGVILGPMDIPDEVTDSLGWAADALGAYEQDFLLPGSGILIWHVDNQALSDAFRVCYGCTNVLPGRRGVDIEEADGIEDLGDIFSVEWTGGVYDYWFTGGFTQFGEQTDPNTRSAGGGRTGISMTVLDSAATSMRVAITRDLVRGGWPLYVGSPAGGDYLSAVDLNGDGADEIVSAAGRYVVALDSEGQGYGSLGGAGLLAVTDSLLRPGVAVQDAFAGVWGTQALLAAASASRVEAWSPDGARQLAYPPDPFDHATLRFTTAPMLCDSILIVGDAQGRVRGLLPDAEPQLRWRTAPSGFPVTALAAGDLTGRGETQLVWGNAIGAIYVADGSQRGGFEVTDGWPQTLSPASDPVRWLLLIAGRPGAGAAEAGHIVALDAAGRIALFSAEGTARPGWPQSLESRPAGAPAVGDPDGDGALEIVATGIDGRIHVWSLDGEAERFWPRSIWHPDVAPFGALGAGPLLLDMDDDGRPEILQGGGDGTLHILDADGDPLAGSPLAVGFTVTSGPVPLIVPRSDRPGESAIYLLAADEAGFATILHPPRLLPARAPRAGEMWRSDVDAGRTRCYPARWQPEMRAFAGLLDGDYLRLTPNPVDERYAWLRVRMGERGSLRVRLRDTSGHQVWEKLYHPAAGQAGDLLRLDLGALASGLYVAQIEAAAGGHVQRELRKLAIVR
ncbi:MAG: hypothetical protein GF330_05775 [Candidatus Eisenbacteria bacterium]|nr:hypothetical protein [Candidatus Eisenbacteria bacterium]